VGENLTNLQRRDESKGGKFRGLGDLEEQVWVERKERSSKPSDETCPGLDGENNLRKRNMEKNSGMWGPERNGDIDVHKRG